MFLKKIHHKSSKAGAPFNPRVGVFRALARGKLWRSGLISPYLKFKEKPFPITLYNLFSSKTIPFLNLVFLILPKNVQNFSLFPEA